MLISSIHILMTIQIHLVKKADVPALSIDIIVMRGHGKSSSASDWATKEVTILSLRAVSLLSLPWDSAGDWDYVTEYSEW